MYIYQQSEKGPDLIRSSFDQNINSKESTEDKGIKGLYTPRINR